MERAGRKRWEVETGRDNLIRDKVAGEVIGMKSELQMTCLVTWTDRGNKKREGSWHTDGGMRHCFKGPTAS